MTSSFKHFLLYSFIKELVRGNFTKFYPFFFHPLFGEKKLNLKTKFTLFKAPFPYENFSSYQT